MELKSFREWVNEAKIDVKSIISSLDMSEDNIRKIANDKNTQTLVPSGTMFYAINSNDKQVSKRTKTNINANIIKVDNEEYFITTKLDFSGKKKINEPMFALVK